MRLKARSCHRGKEIPAKTFLNKEDGAATVFIVVMFALMIAFTGMVIDVGRIMNIHSQANSYVDRVALAAAAELDGDLGAMQRAVRAGVGDATDGPVVPEGFRFSLSGDNAVGVARMVFMSAITDDDNNPYARSPLAGDTVLCQWTPGGGFDCSASGLDEDEADLEASFVLVEATTETETYVMFPIAAALAPGMATDASVAPQAVAGFRREVCNIVPLFLCNPNEQVAGTGAPFEAIPGQQILGVMGDKYAPGNFGFVSSFEGNGAADWRNTVARRDPNTSCISGTLTTKPGAQTGPAAQGLNVRFDLYTGPMKPTDLQLVPAPNVAKGLDRDNKGCPVEKRDDTTTMPLPRDKCFTNGAIAGVDCADSPGEGEPNRFGNGDWDLDAYWAANHGNDPAGEKPAAGISRYDMYRYEIESETSYGGLDDPGLTDETDGSGELIEPGNPTCSASPINTDRRADRRVLIVAAANCEEHEGDLNGRRPVPVEAFVKVFLTEPVGITVYNDLYNSNTGDNRNIFYEVVGVVDPGDDDGILHEYPVLYR